MRRSVKHIGSKRKTESNRLNSHGAVLFTDAGVPEVSHRLRRAGIVQFSSFRFLTRSNSAVLFVTSVTPSARA